MRKAVYLIRHGLIRSNEREIYAGRNAEELTEKGVEQAERLGRVMEGWGIGLIYTSPLPRTRQTAEILNRCCKARLIEDQDLIEMDLGPWTGLSKQQVRAAYPAQYRAWLEAPGRFTAPGMETLESVQQRVIGSVDRFLGSEPERVAAFVTHAVGVKVAVLRYARLPLDGYHQIEAPNLAVYRVCFSERGDGRVERLN